MEFILVRPDGSKDVLHTLHDFVVGMNGPMVGSGGKGEAFHARIGDGFTLVLDIYQVGVVKYRGRIWGLMFDIGWG